MAIEIPDDWAAQRWAEEAPLAHLETHTPGDTADPTRWFVANWSSTREIASSSLPGQVRAKTGLSIGTGKALLKREENDYPWKQGLVYELTGQDAQILLAPEGRTEIPTGQFRIAPVQGELTTLGVDVDLEEKQIEGRQKSPGVLGEQWVSSAQFADSARDPSWLVAELAQQMGYGVGLVPGEGGYTPLLDIPFQGSLATAFPKGVPVASAGPFAWTETKDGVIAMTQEVEASTANPHYSLDDPITASVIITMDVRDKVRFLWDSNLTPGQVGFEVTNRAGIDGYAPGSPAQDVIDLLVRSRGANGSTNTSTTASFSYAQVTDRIEGLQIQFEVLSSDGVNWTGARARVARGEFAPWSAWVTHTSTNIVGPVSSDSDLYSVWLEAVPNTIVGVTSLSMLSRFTMVDTALSGTAPNRPVDLWNNTRGRNGRLYLEPLFGTITSPWLDPELTVWGAMQAIVEAWQGALITDVYGDLRVLNRFSLTGVGTGVEMPIDVGLRFEDLPWIMDYADQADRLVFKYRPVVVRAADPGAPTLPVIWEASDVIIAYPGNNDVFFTLDYVYPVDLKLLAFVRKDFDDGFRHVWDAYRYNNGTGAHINPGDDIAMRIDRVTSSTWKIRIENRTASPFHMVDNSGTPWLKIRSSYWLDQSVEQVIERGLPSTEAANPIEIDVSNYVQNAADANALADFIWARSNQRNWRASTVNSVPDYRLDLGDVVELTHARTGVRSNALVTKVDLAGEPGQVTQKLDLVLIPPTWEDFDEAWVSDTWNEFDALWAPYTWNDFDRTPTATTVAEIEEAM